MNKPPPVTGIEAAIRSLDEIGVRGSAPMLARKLGVSRAAVNLWRRVGVPLNRLHAIHEATGVPLEVLRPGYRDDVAEAAHKIGLPAEMIRSDFFGRRTRRRREPASVEVPDYP